jgi:hypothetical protein
MGGAKVSVSYGPPQHDRSFGDAVEDAHKDYARLTHIHEFSWSVDLSGTVIWRCACSSSVPRNAASADTHILTEVRKARGPVRPPKR